MVLKPFWQHQDLANRHARLVLDLGNASDVPYDEVPHAVGLADDMQESAYRPFSRPHQIEICPISNSSRKQDHWVRSTVFFFAGAIFNVAPELNSR